MDCRCCRLRSFDLKSLFTAKFESLALEGILFQLTGVKILINEEFSSMICSSCELEMIQAFRFCRRVQEIDKSLKISSVKAENEEYTLQCLPEAVTCDQSDIDSHNDPMDDESFMEEPKSREKGKEFEPHPDLLFPADPSKPYTCSLCFSAYSAKLYLTRHMRKKHMPKGSYVPKIVPNRPTKQSGSRTCSHDSKPFTCNECQKRFAKKEQIYRHLRRIHFTSFHNHLCLFCAKRFPEAPELTSHINQRHKEESERKFGCSLCPRKYNTNASLLVHVRSIHEEPAFPCDLCDLLFKVPATLKTHKANKHGIGQVQSAPCPDCGRIFKTKIQLNAHYSVRHQLKNVFRFECNRCEEKFSMNSRYRAHVRKHSGETFECLDPSCSKKFVKKQNMKEHFVKKHSGEEPKFICDLCHARYHFSHNLKQHIRSVHKRMKNTATNFS